ncbi:hypothetical protein NDU88_005165 [Pleurodeles waltl]|uniref:Uncharacterized protein n=1 Tax=Pleurodeles waltl TaxID=8319 RepID=A0AAV7UHD1_PLEWA|nr:hypothetical protein NDU88_005165 [Pleurodeles waltl]
MRHEWEPQRPYFEVDLPVNHPDNSAAAAIQNGGHGGAVSPLWPRPSAGGVQRTHGGENPHAIHRGAPGVQAPLPLAARVKIRSGAPADLGERGGERMRCRVPGRSGRREAASTDRVPGYHNAIESLKAACRDGS